MSTDTLNNRIPSRHFALSELVHPDILAAYGDKAWNLLDLRMIKVIDHLRNILGPCTINNYRWGGGCRNSGLRTTYRSPGSAHRFGMAYDLKFRDASTKDAHHYIRENQEKLYDLGLRRVENLSATPTWCHIDGKPAPLQVNPGGIYFFNP